MTPPHHTRISSLTQILTETYHLDANPRLVTALATALGEATAHISWILANNHVQHSYAGTQNASGDDQLHLDIECDAAVFDAVRASGVFGVAVSEETPVETNVTAPMHTNIKKQDDKGNESLNSDDELFVLGFDPLDGSSIIDANFTVGSIYGIWPGGRVHKSNNNNNTNSNNNNSAILGKTGRHQIASAIALYGPRTTLTIALPSSSSSLGRDVVFEVTLTSNRTVWDLTRSDLKIQPSWGKIVAPGNLRAMNDNEAYHALIQYWMKERYTLRYTGGMVPDVYHILVKGKGVFSNVSSEKAKAKLRLVYEVAPVGLLVECAGGLTAREDCNGDSVLDIEIEDLDQRMGVCFGGRDEVELFKEFLFGGRRE